MTEPHVASSTSAESPPSGTSGAPSTPSRRRSDLFAPRSILGALGVVAVLCFFGFGLRAIDENLKTSGFEVGSAYDVSDTVSFTPAAGWSIDESATVPGAVVTLTDNGVTTKVLSQTLPPTDTLESFAKVFYDSDEQSDAYTDVTPLETFTTASGARGVTWSATGPTDASQNWIVAVDRTAASMKALGTASDWSQIQGDLDAMAESITVTPKKGASP